MIGKRLLSTGFVFLLAARAAFAAGGVEFRAEVDRPQVSQDESVSLKLTIESEGGGVNAGEPEFSAPGFEVLNEYRSTRSMLYDYNGQMSTKSTVEITKVLRPEKTGSLKITGIKVTAGGKTLTAPDVNVTVVASGGETPPPRGYGGGGVALRGAGKHASSSVFLRAEVDKSKVYKGEQVVVSYYLYQRVKVFNIDINKYPTLGGFLREDLEMPVITRQLTGEHVVLDGVPYERYLLVRYAAYPLQEGSLKIDSMAMKYSYYAAPGQQGIDNDDPFTTFFQQLAPRTGTTSSQPLSVESVPLPEQGRPQSFTGAVGDFDVSSSIDKTDVHANEPVTLSLKIEGRGNVAAIGEPKAHWPDQVELYDSKGHAETGRAGVGKKTFEFLLIPRQPGRLELPGLELSFFDPAKQAYVTKTTQPIVLNVGEPAPGTALTLRSNGAAAGRPADNGSGAQPSAHPGVGGAAPTPTEEPLGLKAPVVTNPGPDLIQPVWRWLYWLFAALLFFFVALVAADVIRRTLRAPKAGRVDQAATRSWQALKSFAGNGLMQAPWNDVSQAYEKLTGLVLDAIEAKYPVGARSLPRADLRGLLVGERKVSEDAWRQIEQVLEYAELVRFANDGGGAIAEQTARAELPKRIVEAESAVRGL